MNNVCQDTKPNTTVATQKEEEYNPHPLVKGDRVKIWNQNLKGEPIMEGEAKIVRPTASRRFKTNSNPVPDKTSDRGGLRTR